MDAIVTELAANRLMYDECIQDEAQWAQNLEVYMRGLPRPGSMSETAPLLLHFKQWWQENFVSTSTMMTTPSTCSS